MLNPSKYIIKNPSWSRRFVTELNKSGAMLPVILLEATVTGGRTYQGYKRDGIVEARERITEESLAAVFWLFGAKAFSAILDKLGQRFLSIPKNMPDVGRDALRTPFSNYIFDLSKKKNLSINSEKIEKTKSFLAKYSVGKTFSSLALACVFIGIVVPKFNQYITKRFYRKMESADPNHTKAPDFHKDKLTIKDARNLFSAKDVSINAVENFKAVPKDKKSAAPSFKSGVDKALRIVQNFEENDVWKLMGTDFGTVTGRTVNARNNDERIEISFRDISSIYFYCFSMPHIVSFLNGKDVFKGKNTRLDPMSARYVHNHLIKNMARKGLDASVSDTVFKEFALGKDLDKELMSKFFEPRENKVVKKHLFGLIKTEKFLEPRYLKLDEFIEKVNKFAPESERERLISLGRRMSEELQPMKFDSEENKLYRIITESQVEDVLRGGAVREPQFMKKLMKGMFDDIGLFDKKYSKGHPITNPYKYIASTTIEEKRERIINYVQAIIDDAKNSHVVTADRMLELNKRNMKRNGIFMILAMGVSSLFLSTLIPKMQYYITYLRTGKNTFPGVEDINK